MIQFLKKIKIFFLFAALLMVLPHGVRAANLLFSEGFDDSNYASRGWYDGTYFSLTSSNCYSGSCAQFPFAQGATTWTGSTGAMRKEFAATDSMYVSMYLKFATGWRGSQQLYHPHMFLVLSDLDDAANKWSPLANNYLDTYVEFLSDIGSPYAIRPVLALQDELNVNTSYGTPPVDLSAITENRSVNDCNTPLYAGVESGDCYADFTYYSANRWKASSTSVATNAWHHVEAYFHMNSISGSKGQHDGIMQEWIDGTQVINQSNVLYRTNQHPTMKWAQFVIAPYIGDGAPIAETFYLDSLSVYDGLPSSDTTPPASPTGLSVI